MAENDIGKIVEAWNQILQTLRDVLSSLAALAYDVTQVELKDHRKAQKRAPMNIHKYEWARNAQPRRQDRPCHLARSDC